MPSYNTSYLWDNDRQSRTIGGWDELLMEWEESLYQNAFVATVLENLKATSNWDSGKDYPLSHFLRFLAYEPQAVKWFLYETVSLRWMWGESRIDYVKELVRIVDLDSTFPVFPGSPLTSQTVREFLENHLNEDELEYVEMPSNITIRVNSDGRRIITTNPNSANSNPTSIQPSRITTPQRQEEPEPKVKKVNKVKKEKKSTIAPLQIRFNRESEDDDIITIRPDNYDEDFTYTIVFRDTSAKVTHEMYGMDEFEIQEYLSEVLRMSVVDCDPYQNIQISFPGRPQVLIPYNPDSYTRQLIYDSVESIMNNWPISV
jgi:hypothetical protein